MPSYPVEVPEAPWACPDCGAPLGRLWKETVGIPRAACVIGHEFEVVDSFVSTRGVELEVRKPHEVPA